MDRLFAKIVLPGHFQEILFIDFEFYYLFDRYSRVADFGDNKETLWDR